MPSRPASASPGEGGPAASARAERIVYGLPCGELVAVLHTARSAPDPRLDSILAAIRREWSAIARARYPGLGDDIADAVQVALMKLISPEKLATLTDPTCVDRWARSIFVNTALDALRDGQRRHRRSAAPEEADETDLLDRLPSPAPDPEETMRRAQRLDVVRRCLARVEVAGLRYVEDLPELEIAARTGTTRDAVASRLKRFRRWLREELERDE